MNAIEIEDRGSLVVITVRTSESEVSLTISDDLAIELCDALAVLA